MSLIAYASDRRWNGKHLDKSACRPADRNCGNAVQPKRGQHIAESDQFVSTGFTVAQHCLLA